MTRYTNVRKRSYVEAGFNHNVEEDTPLLVPDATQNDQRESTAEPERKKWKRSNSGKTNDGDGNLSQEKSRGLFAEDASGSQDAAEGTDGTKSREKSLKKTFGKNGKFKGKRVKDADARKFSSEQRRLKRKDQRHAETICYACREKGHAAKDCTKAIDPSMQEGEQRSARRARQKMGMNTVGICYRCGSRKHNLSRCKASVDPENPLPYASCFVCSGTGHLASSCPKNQSNGIYPDGGCCKLCGETTHLAKDCALRKQEVASTTLFLGTGREAGADEDDFHTFKRRNAEVDKAENTEQCVRRQANVKMGAHSGVVKLFGKPPATTKSKVVYF